LSALVELAPLAQATDRGGADARDRISLAGPDPEVLQEKLSGARARRYSSASAAWSVRYLATVRASLGVMTAVICAIADTRVNYAISSWHNSRSSSVLRTGTARASCFAASAVRYALFSS